MARPWLSPLLLVLVCASGCRGRASAVVGAWNWTKPSSPTVRVYFEDNGTWTTLPTGGRLTDDGSWELTGDDLSLQKTTIDPPVADPDHYALSGDGKRLVGRKAGDGTMVRLD